MPEPTSLDREYVSRYSGPSMGLVVHHQGSVHDADADPSVKMIAEEGSTEVFSRTATRASEGTYEIYLTSADTQAPGYYRLDWTYQVNSVDQVFQTFMEVGGAAPEYDSLDGELKLVVERVWYRFADLYDSPAGGPHLQVYFQTHFGRNRLAQLLRVSVGNMNTLSQPHQSYSIDGDAPFPVATWGPLLEQMLYVETIKHLRRSYVEQPMLQGAGGIATLDRRDYLQRWGEILRDEQGTLDAMLSHFKLANMGLGQARVLVSGGVYGSFAPSRLPGSAAARPRYYYAFH